MWNSKKHIMPLHSKSMLSKIACYRLCCILLQKFSALYFPIFILLYRGGVLQIHHGPKVLCSRPWPAICWHPNRPYPWQLRLERSRCRDWSQKPSMVLLIIYSHICICVLIRNWIEDIFTLQFWTRILNNTQWKSTMLSLTMCAWKFRKNECQFPS